MVSKKHVRAYCSGPIAAGPHYKSPWEDVWLSWKGKPGRRIYRAAPRLECRRDLMPRIYRAAPRLECRRDLMPKTTKAERASWYRDEDAAIQQALKELETQPYAILDYGRTDNKHLETVVTTVEGIDRAEAERMLAFYLERIFNVRHVKFEWNKPEFVIIPTGFGNYK